LEENSDNVLAAALQRWIGLWAKAGGMESVLKVFSRISRGILGKLRTCERLQLSGLPFINMELVDQEAFEHFTQKTFATDRDLVPTGMIEVIP
jgi:hypothetical protein